MEIKSAGWARLPPPGVARTLTMASYSMRMTELILASCNNHLQEYVSLIQSHKYRGKLGNGEQREWQTPHFQQKCKRGHDENSLWQLIFVHSLVVCSDLGDLPKFCSTNF